MLKISRRLYLNLDCVPGLYFSCPYNQMTTVLALWCRYSGSIILLHHCRNSEEHFHFSCLSEDSLSLVKFAGHLCFTHFFLYILSFSKARVKVSADIKNQKEKAEKIRWESTEQFLTRDLVWLSNLHKFLTTLSPREKEKNVYFPP